MKSPFEYSFFFFRKINGNVNKIVFAACILTECFSMDKISTKIWPKTDRVLD